MVHTPEKRKAVIPQKIKEKPAEQIEQDSPRAAAGAVAIVGLGLAAVGIESL